MYKREKFVLEKNFYWTFLPPYCQYNKTIRLINEQTSLSSVGVSLDHCKTTRLTPFFRG